MDNFQKQKLESLKEQARIKTQRRMWMENELLQEFLSALETYMIVDDEDLINNVVDIASKKDAKIYSHNDEVLLDDEKKYYIVWDEASLPVV